MATYCTCSNQIYSLMRKYTIGRDHSTITKFLKRYDERNSVENKLKTGRKKLVTERGDRVILRSVKVNRRETETGRGSLSFTMFVKSLKVSLLLTFTERKITRSPRSVTNFFLPVLGLFSTEFLSS
jgi:hypothetical protein